MPQRKGCTPWNKGMRGVVTASEEARAKMRAKMYARIEAGKHPALGRKHSQEWRRARSEMNKALGIVPPSSKGKKRSPETIRKMGEAQRARCAGLDRNGPKSPHWKGGITARNKLDRTCKRFYEWRASVFSRDDWTCQRCKVRGGRIHAHHVKEFSKYPKLRFVVANGLTLCCSCHRRVHRELRATNFVAPD